MPADARPGTRRRRSGPSGNHRPSELRRRSRHHRQQVLDHLVDRQAARVDDDRVGRLACSGLSARVESFRSRSMIDASTSSTSPPISATRRSARTRGDAVMYSFSAASGNTTEPMSRPSTTPPPALGHPLPLAADQFGAHPAVGRDRADGRGDLAATDLDGGVDAVDGHAVIVDRRARALRTRRRRRRRRTGRARAGGRRT